MQNFTRSFRLILIALLTFAIVACGDSDFEQVSTTSSGVQSASPGLPIADEPDFFADPGPKTGAAAGPVTARAAFTFSGTSNANQAPFNASPSSIVQAGFRPNSSPATTFVFALQNGLPNGASRTIRLEVSGGPSKLQAGDRFSANAAQSGAIAKVDYVDKPQANPSSLRVFLSTGGEVVITQLSSNSVTVRFENVRLAPNPRLTSQASGNPVINGEGSFNF